MDNNYSPRNAPRRRGRSATSVSRPQTEPVQTPPAGRTLGFCASCEQYPPAELVKQCQEAEKAGFQAILVSDHFQPWVPAQGQASFIWTVIGAIGQVTSLPICSGVCTPGYRMHPAILAQAAATTAALLPQRFALGLGAGEALNEHVVGGYWPGPQERCARLLESISLIQSLLRGETVRFQGKYYQTEQCRLYTLPEVPPPVFVATSGPYLSKKAGELTDGILTPGADVAKLQKLLYNFDQGVQNRKSVPELRTRNAVHAHHHWIQIHVSWAPKRQTAMANAIEQWPNGGMNFPKADIRDPEDFAAMAAMVRPEHFVNRVTISHRAEDHLAAIESMFALGFDRVYVHNCGRNQSDWLRFCAQEIIPELKLRQ